MGEDIVRRAQIHASAWRLAMPAGRYHGYSGGAFGRRQGASHEFLEHRDYVPGDDIRRVDWKAFARSDRMTVKCYQEEVAPSLDLLLDCSASMNHAQEKRVAVLGLAAFVAQVAHNSGFAVRAWAGSEGFDRFADDRGAVTGWIWPEFGGDCSLHAAFLRRPPKLNGNGLVVVISDLLMLEEPTRLVSSLARDAALTVFLQVLTREEEAPTLSGASRLCAAEGGQMELIADVSTLRRYRGLLDEHRSLWRRACLAHGALFSPVTAEEFSAGWLLPELIAAGLLQPC